MNTIENKEKFYALYLYQTVVTTPHLIYTGNPPEPSHDEWGEDSVRLDNLKQLAAHNFPLELTPLSAISDEDAAYVSNVAGLGSSDYFKKVEQGKVLLTQYLTSSRCNVQPNDWLQIFDYLRSKSYALPWNGISVEQQMEYGWITLKD